MPCANMPKVIGVVLAGGHSSRMGQNKALMQYHGETMLDRALLLLNSCGIRQSYVSGKYAGYLCIEDSIEDIGPLGGIYSAFQALSHTLDSNQNILFIPVDMPLLNKPVLMKLIEKKSLEAYAFKKSPFPLMLSLTTGVNTVLKRLCEAPSTKCYSIHHFLSCIKHEHVPLESVHHASFMNVNCPEQWGILSQTEHKENKNEVKN
jgi:molybdenum cofactor guanylyltransferase